MRLTLSVATCAAISALSPGMASADTYAPGANAQDFGTDQGGWTSGIRSDGLCVPGVTCPVVANSYVNAGGAGGAGGFIRTSMVYIATVGTMTHATWTSPTFTYNGDRGGIPSEVTFTMDRRANVGQLVGAGGSNASFSVVIHNASTNRDITIVPPTTQLNAVGWTGIPAVSIMPSRLNIGDRYQFRITSIYDAVTADVLGNGTSDYDNVVLETSGAASGILDASTLRRLILGSQGLPGSATFNSKGKTLSIKVRCPSQAAPAKCRYRSLQGLSGRKGSRRATTRKNVSVSAGKSKTVKLRVRSKYLPIYRKASKITIKTKVSVGKVSTTVFKRVNLIKR
jgi:hypothetical protein